MNYNAPCSYLDEPTISTINDMSYEMGGNGTPSFLGENTIV